jgi:signal transduction histidine kinase
MPRYYNNPETGRLEAYGVSRDITERRAKEAEIHQLNVDLEQRVTDRTLQLETALAELRHAEELKDAFLASVSHELRTPLTGILGISEALDMQISGPLNERQLHYIQQIRQSGDRLLQVVNSIMQYTALLAGRVTIQPAPCRLIELGATCMRAVYTRVVDKALTPKLSVEPLDLEILSDANTINMVLSNLLDNAIKFTPAGGKIGLEVVDDPSGEVVHLTVWDTGIGIAAEQQRDAFRAFEQLDHGLTRQYEGLGLGLSFAQQLVRLLGGEIKLESAPGVGSRFIVTLPVALPQNR